MRLVKKILCPTDFSEPSFRAVKAADILAKQFSAEVFLLHVVTPLPAYPTAGIAGVGGAAPGFDFAAYYQEIEASAEKSMGEVVDNFISDKVTVQTSILRGDAADSIVSFAREEDVDVIVIATHGYTGFRHFVFGSVAEKVVRMADRPVLTIRAHEEPKER